MRGCSNFAGIVCTKGAVTNYIIAVGWDKRIVFFEDNRLKRVNTTRQVPASQPAHDSDILACALMEDSPNLVTASTAGELKLWNIESGTMRRLLVWPGISEAPAHCRTIETLLFFVGTSRLKHVCLAAGGDQVVRFWDINQCRLVHEFFTGEFQP
jgi:WD40 repeat protein